MTVFQNSKRWAAVFLLALACTRTARPPVCVPGDSCAPSDPCRAGAIACDPQIACVATDAGTRDGTACATGRVCSAGECVLCAEGSACTPAGDPCHAGVLGCSTGQPVCTASANAAPDGTPCGDDLLCAASACAPGDGADGALIYSGSAPLETARATAAGQAGAMLLTVDSSTGFAAGQQLFIHQTQGTDAGHWEEAQVVAVVSATSLSLLAPLQHTYGLGAQALVERRFTDFTVPAGATLSPAPWDGFTGSIIAFKARGTVRIDGRISASGAGYRGGTSQSSPVDYVDNQQGESTSGTGQPLRSPANSAANGDGGGSGCGAGSGGGGGNGKAGAPGIFVPSAPFIGCTNGCTGGVLGQAGASAGLPDLSLAVPGGGGGASGSQAGQGRNGAAGGNGGGLIFIHARAIEVVGRLDADGANGANGYNGATQPVAGGGGGAGGGIRLVAGSVHIIGPVTALGGAGGAPPNPSTGSCIPAGTGGAGGDGRIFLSAPDLQGSTSPAAATATAP